MKVRYLLVMQCRCMSVQACANVRASRQACAGMDMSVCVCTRARVNVHDTYRHASAPSARRCHGTRCLLCACRQKPHNCCLRLRHGQHGSLVACDSGSAAISLRKPQSSGTNNREQIHVPLSSPSTPNTCHTHSREFSVLRLCIYLGVVTRPAGHGPPPDDDVPRWY